jgi:hypothetical protein
MTDDDEFFLKAAEQLEQQHQLLIAAKLHSHSSPLPLVPNAVRQSESKSTAKQLLAPEVIQRIEANRAAALARLKLASTTALNTHNPTLSAVPSHAGSDSASEAECCSSQSSITSYFKPSNSNSCSNPRKREKESGDHLKQHCFLDENALPPACSPVSSQNSIASSTSRKFQPFTTLPSSQSHSKPLPCAACGFVCSSDSCSRGCILVYPCQPQIRGYQLDIARRCVVRNTLVVLPTGLGKTLIAAVVMHNFSRWHPESCVIFLAPTRPLAAQQHAACARIVPLPPLPLAITVTGASRQKLQRAQVPPLRLPSHSLQFSYYN